MAGPSRTRPPLPLPHAFTVDEERFVLRDRPLRWWMRVLVSEPPGCWWQIVPGNLAGDGPRRLLDRLHDPGDRFDLDDIEAVAEQVAGEVLGIDLYPAQRLMQMAYGNWIHFEAWTIQQGLPDPLAGSPGRLCSAVYAWRQAGCEKKADISKLDNEIFAAPPARHVSGRFRDPAKARGWDHERESAAFMDAFNQMGKR